MAILIYQEGVNGDLTYCVSQKGEGKHADSGSMLKLDVLGVDSTLNMKLI